ncbi:unnamed protein product [Heligmosomoides polygyrus]|uniref:Omp85 domain-containing protein n=1 Tax=Heligmosomoides polygyrus TaxID=6339 RepID=A0A183G3N3_HELPZ|nr:unnamed protein product [Heligmosomoides polygyrus]
MSRVRHGEGVLKPRDAYDSAAYVSRVLFQLNHGRLLANYILGGLSSKFTIYSAGGASKYEWGPSAERRDSEDVLKTSSNVRRDPEDVPNTSATVHGEP